MYPLIALIPPSSLLLCLFNQDKPLTGIDWRWLRAPHWFMSTSILTSLMAPSFSLASCLRIKDSQTWQGHWINRAKHFNAINCRNLLICERVKLCTVRSNCTAFCTERFLCKPTVNLKHMGVDDRKQTQRFKCDTKDGDVTYCRTPPQLKAHFSSLLFV